MSTKQEKKCRTPAAQPSSHPRASRPPTPPLLARARPSAARRPRQAPAAAAPPSHRPRPPSTRRAFPLPLFGPAASLGVRSLRRARPSPSPFVKGGRGDAAGVSAGRERARVRPPPPAKRGGRRRPGPVRHPQAELAAATGSQSALAPRAPLCAALSSRIRPKRGKRKESSGHHLAFPCGPPP